MWHDDPSRRHVKNVQNETDNPAILNDVISSEMEQHPGQNAERTSPLTPIQEVIRNNTDGKTWQNMDE